MSLKDELDAYVQKTLDEQWERRAGECPILCVRGVGLQVVRESVGVSHG